MSMRRPEGGPTTGGGHLGTVSVMVVIAFLAALALALFGDVPGEPTIAPTATPIEQVAAATATPVRATPPPTSSNDNSSNSGSVPLMLILIALAFGGLGMLAVQAQRRTIRR